MTFEEYQQALQQRQSDELQMRQNQEELQAIRGELGGMKPLPPMDPPDLVEPYRNMTDSLSAIDQRLANVQGYDVLANMGDMQQRGENPLPGYQASPQPIPLAGLSSQSPQRPEDILAKEIFGPNVQLGFGDRFRLRQAMADGGLLTYANQRAMRAQQMQQLEEQKQQHAFQEMMSIDKELANEPEKWQMAMEQRAAAGNMFAQTMIQAGAKQIAGDFAEVAEAVQKLYPKIAKQYETNPKSVSPSTMKSVIKASHDFVIKKRDATLKETAVREDMQALIDKVTQNPDAVTAMEANTLKQFYDEEEKRKLTLEELKQKITATKAPKEVYSGIQGAQGESVTGIFDPQTGQVRELRGTPIQRVQTDEPKFTPEQAARVSAMNQTLNNLADLRSTLIPDGQKVDRGVLFTSMFGGLPFTGGRDVERYIEDAIETKLRLQTGAAANREEVVKEAKKFKPSQLDTDATIIGKFDKLERYMQDTFNVLDPSGVVRARLGEAGGNIGQPPIPFEQAYESLKKSRPGWSNTDIFKELQRRGVRP